MLKIATWNINGIRARHPEVVSWAAREVPDILCLQEIKATAEQIPDPLFTLTDYWSYWHGAKGYSGVSLHIRKSFSSSRPEFSHPPFDHESRIVTARVGAWVVASIYAPNGGKDYPAKLRFLRALEAYAGAFRDDSPGGALVLCGDLNVTRTAMDVHPKDRGPATMGQRPEERALIEQLISHDLVDVGRALDPDNDQLYTWWAPWRNRRERNIGWRLDYILASSSLGKRAQSAESQREFGTSDHAPVVAVFDDAGAH